jgi:hypothetical protein
MANLEGKKINRPEPEIFDEHVPALVRGVVGFYWQWYQC